VTVVIQQLANWLQIPVHICMWCLQIFWCWSNRFFCVHKLETDAEKQVFQLVARPQLTGGCCVTFYSVMT